MSVTTKLNVVGLVLLITSLQFLLLLNKSEALHEAFVIEPILFAFMRIPHFSAKERFNNTNEFNQKMDKDVIDFQKMFLSVRYNRCNLCMYIKYICVYFHSLSKSYAHMQYTLL